MSATPRQARYRTTPGRAVVAAVVTAAAVSALLTAANLVIDRHIDWAKYGLHPPSLFSLAMGSFTNTALTIALASPLWWWLDRAGVRRWPAAMLVGAAAGALMLEAIDLVRLGRAAHAPDGLDVGNMLLGGIGGAVVGTIIWRIAYRREPDADDAAEAF